MKNDFYTYAYLREDGTPYYIGKGRGNRAFKEHLFVSVPSVDRVLFLKTRMTEEEAFRHEVYMIAIFGRKDIGTGILWNFTDGGEGRAGWIMPEEVKEKISKANKGKPGWNKGKPHPSAKYERTKENRRKISASMKVAGRVKEVQHLGAESRKVAVVGIDPQGVSNCFESASEAAKVTGISRGNISGCCLGHRKTAGGWQWSYLN